MQVSVVIPSRFSPNDLHRHSSSSTRPGQRTYKRRSLPASSSSTNLVPGRPFSGSSANTDDSDNDGGGDSAEEDEAEETLKRKRKETTERSSATAAALSPPSELPPSPSRPSKSSRTSSLLPVKRAKTPPMSASQPKSPTTPKHLRQRHRIISPHSSPKDLSALFVETAGQGSPGASPFSKPSQETPGKRRRARPMLTKAQSMGGAYSIPADVENPGEDDSHVASSPATDSAGPSTPFRGLRRTVSEVIPHAEPEEAPQLPADSAALFGLPPVVEQPGSGGRAKRTYGRTRTMLAPEPLDSLPGSEMDLADLVGTGESAGDQIKESYAELRKKYEVDNEIDEAAAARNIYSTLEIAKAPSTIADMRSKGENRRFMDEVGYLTEGIQDASNSLSVKRVSSIDILRNMQDPEWSSKVLICGQTDRIWDAFMTARGHEDDIMTCVCLIFVALLLSIGNAVEPLIQARFSEIVGMAASQLEQRDGPLDDGARYRKGPMRSSASKLRAVCEDARLQPCGTRQLASMVIEHIYKLDTVDTAQKTFSDCELSHRSARALAVEVQVLSSRFDLCEKGLDLVTEDTQFSLEHLASLLAITNSTEPELAEAIDSLADVLIIALHMYGGEQARTAARVIPEALKVLVGFVKSSLLPDKLLRSRIVLTALMRIVLFRNEIVLAVTAPDPLDHDLPRNGRQEPDGDGRNSDADQLTADDLLGLVLVILRAAVSDESTAHCLAAIRLSEKCDMRHACLRRCHCDAAPSVADHLIAVFRDCYARENDGPMTGALAGLSALVALATFFEADDGRRSITLDEDRTHLLKCMHSSIQSLHDVGVSLSHQAGVTSEDDDEVAALRRLNDAFGARG